MFLSPKSAVNLLGISERTLAALATRGRLPYWRLVLDPTGRIGRRYRRADVLALLVAGPKTNEPDYCPLRQAAPAEEFHRDSAADAAPLWMRASRAAAYLDVNTRTISRRGVPWASEPVPYRIRTVPLAVLGGEPRYYRPDLDRLLVQAPAIGGLPDPTAKEEGFHMLSQEEKRRPPQTLG